MPDRPDRWTVADDVREHVERLWSRGRLLGGASVSFPFAVPLRRPNSMELSDRFEEVRDWIRALEADAIEKRGFGYSIKWEEVEHRRIGRNRVPTGIVIPTRDDALRLVRRVREAERYRDLAELTASGCPALSPWVDRKVMRVLEHAEIWERVVQVVAWMQQHPRAGVYLRQLDIDGVDTKFIELNAKLISELLDIALPRDAVRGDVPRRSFELRYGLRPRPPQIRFRILDERHAIRGMMDVTTTAAEFAALDLPIANVFVTENEINGLAFPSVPDGIVVFGLGYGVAERVADAQWLRDKRVYYWGDIDTHGYAILDGFRKAFPGARSILMDSATLLAHRRAWVREDEPKKADLTRLTPGEREVYDDLVANRHGDRVRLEQERIGYGAFTKALDEVLAP